MSENNVRVLKVAKHTHSDYALRDRGTCQEWTYRLFEPITLSLIEEFVRHFVSTSISVSAMTLYLIIFKRSGDFLFSYVVILKHGCRSLWSIT